MIRTLPPFQVFGFQAPSLEKVLTILDARHIMGQTHPAVALKARIEKLEGINAGEFGFPLAAVEHMPRGSEVMGSNPADYWAFLLLYPISRVS